MHPPPLQTPVLFLVFNRPEVTRAVFAAIRQARPRQLYIAADGPREAVAEDAANCRATREIVAQVDWECRVSTLYREKNLGCRKAVSSAIDWFFAEVEEGIVLEDDCLPAPSFFGYCQELLERYRHDSRIMQICGLNVLESRDRSGHSYHFSAYGPVWGWASWKRAWSYYDVEMKLWPELRERGTYRDFCQNDAEARHRRDIYDRVFSGEIDTWDYQWGLAKLANHGLSVIPARNLISNLGFGAAATHTVAPSGSPFSGMEIRDLDRLLSHPPCMIRDREADREYLTRFMGVREEQAGPGLLRRILQRAFAI